MSRDLHFAGGVLHLSLQPQSHSQEHHIYTEEEAQELVEKAYQEGWQQGMEEGYKLGKDKGYKEYKEEKEEKEAKKAKDKANEVSSAYQDTQSTPRSISRVNSTPRTNSAASKACASTKTTHITPSSSISSNIVTWPSESFSAAPKESMSSISPTDSTPSSEIIEIAKVDHQAVPGGTKCSISDTTASGDPKLHPVAPRMSSTSIKPISGSPNTQFTEIIDSAMYNSPALLKTTQTMHLHTQNHSSDFSDSYIAYFDSQITPKSSQSNQEKNRPLDAHIPESTVSTIPDIQNNGSAPLLVDLDIQ